MYVNRRSRALPEEEPTHPVARLQVQADRCLIRTARADMEVAPLAEGGAAWPHLALHQPALLELQAAHGQVVGAVVDAQVVAGVDGRVPVGKEWDVVPRVIVARQLRVGKLVGSRHEGHLWPQSVGSDHIAQEERRCACAVLLVLAVDKAALPEVEVRHGPRVEHLGLDEHDELARLLLE